MLWRDDERITLCKTLQLKINLTDLVAKAYNLVQVLAKKDQQNQSLPQNVFVTRVEKILCC